MIFFQIRRNNLLNNCISHALTSIFMFYQYRILILQIYSLMTNLALSWEFPYLERQSLYWNSVQRVVWDRICKVTVRHIMLALWTHPCHHTSWQCTELRAGSTQRMAHHSYITPDIILITFIMYRGSGTLNEFAPRYSQTLKVEWIFNYTKYFTQFWVETQPTHSLSIF